jgi:hypothetical protein
MDIVWD